MMLFSFTGFAGNFHPLLVHLPIGMLLLALLMQWVCEKERFIPLQPAIPFVYFVGSISAILSCISGWFLASNGGYAIDTLLYHRWLGIGVAVVSLVCYYFSKKEDKRLSKWLATLLFILITITGHFGGTLTHGEGYLLKGSGDAKDSVVGIKTLPDAQEAVVYADIIQPVLQVKCYGCHAAAKQKGGLRLDGKEWILKGGKEGAAVIPGNPEASELYKRVVLDPLEEKHMPPKGKPQLSEQDRILLHWWIAAGLNFTAKAKELEQPAPIKTALIALEQKTAIKTADVPAAQVAKAEDSTLAALRKMSITVLPVAVNSNYLTANLVNVKELTKSGIDHLLSIKKQLIWLKMPGIQLADDAWKQLSELKQLTRLSIEHSNISDNTIGYMAAFTNLQYINLVDTKISKAGVLKLKGMTALNSMYLGQTNISKDDLAEIQKSFPTSKLDAGGYNVETLASDTELLKQKTVKK